MVGEVPSDADDLRKSSRRPSELFFRRTVRRLGRAPSGGWRCAESSLCGAPPEMAIRSSEHGKGTRPSLAAGGCRGSLTSRVRLWQSWVGRGSEVGEMGGMTRHSCICVMEMSWVVVSRDSHCDGGGPGVAERV